jgi:hypothetical protein
VLDTVSVIVDTEDVEVDVADGVVEIEDVDEDDIIDYLADEYHRGSFSNFDFKKLFEKMGIVNAVKI